MMRRSYMLAATPEGTTRVVGVYVADDDAGPDEAEALERRNALSSSAPVTVAVRVGSLPHVIGHAPECVAA